MKVINSICLLLCCIAAQAQSFSISGHLEGAGDSLVFLYREGQRDTALMKAGHFTFKGSVPHPQEAFIYVPGRFSFTLFIENTDISILGHKDTADAARITGGKTQREYDVFLQMVKPATDKMEPLYALLQKDMSKKDSVLKVTDGIMEAEYYPASVKFIRQHPHSYVSLYKLKELMRSKPLAETEQTFSLLSQDLRTSEAGRQLQKEFDIMHATMPGKPAIDFTMNDRAGKPVSLSSYKGRYVLLDFWASWCKPCREENPAIKKAYARFKDRNFEILAVSLDRDSSAWVKAIETDGLPWHHVSDLQLWNNRVAKMYNIKSIPANFLIGPDGLILAKDLSGHQLEEKLAEIFK